MALLRLEGQPGLKWGVLDFAATDALDGEKLFVVQHPSGEAKQISDEGCAVVMIPAPGRGADTDLAHGCDTLGGSSGSPVFNSTGHVVGLHHWGRANSGTFRNANRAVRGILVREAFQLLEGAQ